MKISKRKIGIVVGLILVGVTTLWYFGDDLAGYPIASKTVTPEWHELYYTQIKAGDFDSSSYEKDPTKIQPTLHLKSGGGQNNLLIRYDNHEVVYLYDVDKKSVERSSVEDWDKLNGDVVGCEKSNSYVADPKSRIEAIYPAMAYEGSIRYNKEPIKTYGKYLINFKESPTHTYVAVRSAYGPLRGATGGMFGGSEAIVYGRRYIQYMKVGDNQVLSDPIRLPTDPLETKSLVEQKICWSADERFIVVYRPQSFFCVIENEIK